MEVYSPAASLAVLDGVSCALLAAAAAAKARSIGSHITGSLVLGCLCGLLAPLLRESVLYGNVGAMQAFSQFPEDALIGSAGGIAALYLGKKLPVLFWLDALSLSLAASFGALVCMRGFGLVGGLALGIIAAVAPGFTADAALGNVAGIVEKDWYVTAAILGAVLGIGVYMAPWFAPGLEFLQPRLLETAILSGAAFGFCLQIWWGRKNF